MSKWVSICQQRTSKDRQDNGPRRPIVGSKAETSRELKLRGRLRPPFFCARHRRRSCRGFAPYLLNRLKVWKLSLPSRLRSSAPSLRPSQSAQALRRMRADQAIAVESRTSRFRRFSLDDFGMRRRLRSDFACDPARKLVHQPWVFLQFVPELRAVDRGLDLQPGLRD
jgi:hypothetical protein